jgi:hypothetical protein
MSEPEVVSAVNVLLPTNERISFDITPATTVSELANFVSCDPRNFVPADRVVVLIYRGRILQPQEIVCELDTIAGFTVHALFRPAHRPIPPPASPDADLRGFDRLLRMNYAPAQIAQLRDNFHVMRGTVNAPRQAQIDAEEEWFPVIFAGENAVQNLQPPPPADPNAPLLQNQAEEAPYMVDRYPWAKLVLGIFLGTVFGIGSIIFMLMPRSDSIFFMGLFLGTCVNFLIKWYTGAELL